MRPSHILSSLITVVFLSSSVGPSAFASPAGAQPSSGGSAGYCLQFDGVDDFVAVTRTAALEPGEITVELWARLDGPQDWNTRLLRKGEHDAYFITADQDHDRRMQLLVTRGTDYRVQAKDTHPHTAYVGTWHHFLGVYASDHAEFWVDGVQVSSVTHDLGALTHLPLTDLYIGAGLPVTLQDEYFAGQIDEVRIWNYPRAPVEIQSSWSATLVGTEPGLVAYWRFDEGGGQAAHDSSPLAHDGRLGTTSLPDASDPIWMISDIPLGPCGGHAVNFCESSPNSSGLAARMQFTGSLSIEANRASLEVFQAPAGHPGFFFYGRDPFHVPMFDGYLCVSPFSPGLVRLDPGLFTDAAGHAQRALDFQALPALGEITPGSTWRFQFWFRDWTTGGAGSNLSDGLEVAFCP